jgi:hypothetical protein
MQESLLNNIPELSGLIFLPTCGFIFRSVLIYVGQSWARSYPQLATFMILPLVTNIVTSVISGNIALSLGMVGALSIVRFRNPVKSPFELVVFFFLITLGISYSVDFRWALLLVFSVSSVIIFIYFLDALLRAFFSISLYSTSFNEGNEMSTLEIISSSSIDDLNENEFLIGFSKNSDSYTYRLASLNVLNLKRISMNYQNKNEVKEINFNIF